MNRPDQDFNSLVAALDGQTITLSDLGFRCAEGAPDNLKVCAKRTWNARMIVETSFSMITVVCGAKKLFHQLHPEAPAHQMSIAEFSL